VSLLAADIFLPCGEKKPGGKLVQVGREHKIELVVGGELGGHLWKQDALMILVEKVLKNEELDGL